MFKLTEDGKLVDAESGKDLPDDMFKKIQSGYGLLTKESAQDMVDKAVSGRIAEVKKQHESNTRELINQLEAEKKNSRLTDEERTGLQSRIDDLSDQLMTAEERAAKKEQQKVRELQEQMKSLEKASQTWKTQYENEYTTHRILTAAQKAKAIRPDDFIDHLKHREVWMEVRDQEGKPTGSVEPRYKLSVYDDDKKESIDGLYTIEKAVDLVAKQNQHWIQGANQSGSGIPSGHQGGKPGVLTAEQIRNMSPDEVDAHFNPKKNSGKAPAIA